MLVILPRRILKKKKFKCMCKTAINISYMAVISYLWEKNHLNVSVAESASHPQSMCTISALGIVSHDVLYVHVFDINGLN